MKRRNVLLHPSAPSKPSPASLTKIVQVHGRQVIDSRGNPTVEAVVTVGGGANGSAIVPSGASTVSTGLGIARRCEKRFLGRGVSKAVGNNNAVAKAVVGMDALDQIRVDKTMIALDGTTNKAKLGANAILAVSLANARAAANQIGLPLFKYLGGPNAKVLPVPMMNIVNGGAHSDAPVDFQEFMIMPKGLPSFSEAVRAGCEIFHALKSVLKERGLSTAVGDEGGFAPNFESADDALETIAKAVKKAATSWEGNILRARCSFFRVL
jgi:enolase